MVPLVMAAVSLALAAVAWRAHALSASGAAAAFLVGWASLSGGGAYGVLLLTFFAAGSALSRLPARTNAEVEAVVEKGASRDAVQVLANGGIFGALAMASLWDARLASAAAGAIAAAMADTMATELGTRLGGRPLDLRSWRRAPRGTSGAITLTGVLASVAGAGVIALIAASLLRVSVVPVLIAGFLGAFADTLLGAFMQQRRRCPRCNELTERRIHWCGTRTEHSSGARWVQNDLVNLAATMVGAAAGYVLR